MPPDHPSARYWDQLADQYQADTRISTTDFHFGPLLPGDRDLEILAGLDLPQPADTLELGCGAAQNAIVLARAGHRATAVDISAGQLAHARRLAAAAGVDLTVHQHSLDALATIDFGRFHLVHSTFALPFLEDPEAFIRHAVRHLHPGGYLLLTTAHPVFAGDFLEDEDGIPGMFLTSYFDPPPDVRHLDDDGADAADFIVARAYPLGIMHDWLTEAGLQVLRQIEPMPCPIPAMDEEQIRLHVPYDSPHWRPLYPAAARHPIVVVYVARKPH